MAELDSQQLDTILALQLTVGWAGEKADQPQRLGWWNTDLTDEAAGGDLFKRLLPKTAPWAGLELARLAAIRADWAARSKLANPDAVWTLFHFGFSLDEALQDRLEHHKRHGRAPGEVFAELWGVRASWSEAAFVEFLGQQRKVAVEETPAGRRVKKLEAEPVAAAQALAAALLPLAAQYPLPHGSAVGAG